MSTMLMKQRHLAFRMFKKKWSIKYFFLVMVPLVAKNYKMLPFFALVDFGLITLTLKKISL